jgi:hypothetical protein
MVRHFVRCIIIIASAVALKHMFKGVCYTICVVRVNEKCSVLTSLFQRNVRDARP